MILPKLWGLEDKFMIVDLQNLIFDQLVRVQSCGCMWLNAYKNIHNKTGAGSPLRRFAVEQAS